MNHNEIKARLLQAEKVEEVTAIAKEDGLALDANAAARLFASLQQARAAALEANKLDDNELEAVAGGDVKGCSICKGTIKNEGLGFSGDKITIIWDPDWCWSGTDYCYKWTETYDGIKIY